MSIHIPIGVRIGKYKELSPQAQQLLLKMIDHAYAVNRVDTMSPDQFRESVIELLETGEAYLEDVPGGIALKLDSSRSDWLI